MKTATRHFFEMDLLWKVNLVTVPVYGYVARNESGYDDYYFVKIWPEKDKRVGLCENEVIQIGGSSEKIYSQ